APAAQPAAPAPGAAPAPAPAAAEEKAPPKPSAAEPAPVEVAAVAPDPVARGKGATAQDKADDGLGLVGTGEGGGGTGEGIGLGNVGTMGRGGGTGGGTGYGAGAGAGSSHPGTVALSEVAVPADSPAPVAVARRVVVARSGLYRACYQRELARDPSLQGAITFALDVKDTGLVAKVTAAPPADLVTVSDCVRQQLSRLRFPTQAKAWTASVAMTFKP
ncbi:MAG: AgmX/PglI C-terminal domain-containing protein, partial [Deltaproteobacteria bacterium]|nr:AgmX/PglI C-terminal domain-containing protein [Deltaproteobacteria bacterium]